MVVTSLDAKIVHDQKPLRNSAKAASTSAQQLNLRYRTWRSLDLLGHLGALDVVLWRDRQILRTQPGRKRTEGMRIEWKPIVRGAGT